MTKATPEPDVYDGPAVRLMAQIVGANVESLANVTNAIQANQEAQIKSWAKSFLALYKAIEAIPPMLLTVHLARYLEHYGWQADQAERLIQGEQD